MQRQSTWLQKGISRKQRKNESKNGEHRGRKGGDYRAGCARCYSAEFTRACLKIHSRHLHPLICVIFLPNSVNVARYASFIWQKSPTNCRIHLSESNFQTRSSATGKNMISYSIEPLGQEQITVTYTEDFSGKSASQNWNYKIIGALYKRGAKKKTARKLHDIESYIRQG